MVQGLKKYILIFVLAFTVGISFPHAAHAGYWGEPTMAAFLKQALEKIERQIEGVILASLKGMAIQMLNNQIGQLIGGGSGRPLFVSDWQQFIYGTATDNAALYMNDFFAQTTRGKYASANYIGVGDVGAVSGNYVNYLVRQAQLATTDIVSQRPYYNLDTVSGSPSQVFSNGDWRGFSLMFSNPANNPYGYTLMAQDAYQSALAQSIEVQKAEGIAGQGFLGAKQGGQIVTPARTVGDVVGSIKNLGNEVVANSSNPGELLGGVITAVVNKSINSLVSQGIGMVQSKIQSQFGSVGGQVGKYLSNQLVNSGPGAAFTQKAQQEAAIKMRSYTNPANYGHYDP